MFDYNISLTVIVIVKSKLLKRHSKAKRRAPAYSRAPTRNYFAVIRTDLKFGNRAFSVSGPREWNSLPASVRQCIICPNSSRN